MPDSDKAYLLGLRTFDQWLDNSRGFPSLVRNHFILLNGRCELNTVPNMNQSDHTSLRESFFLLFDFKALAATEVWLVAPMLG